MKITTSLFVLLGALATSHSHATCFVDSKAAGANTGTSWTDAYSNLQTALVPGDCDEVWVAKGVYRPTDTPDREISFQIPPNIQIFGGFAGNESTRNARDSHSNRTILSGDIGRDDINSGTSDIDQTTDDIRGDNSYHVVMMDGTTILGPIDSNTVLDGFTITGGNASDGTYTRFSHSNGGGLLCLAEALPSSDSECSPMLNNLRFNGNNALEGGGALLNFANGGRSSPIVENTEFAGNGASYGAVENEGANGGHSNPVFRNVLFANNSGGAISNYSYNIDGATGGTSKPTLFNTTLISGSDPGCRSPLIVNDADYGGEIDGLFQNVTALLADCQFGGGEAFLNIGVRGGRSTAQLTNVTVTRLDSSAGQAIRNATDALRGSAADVIVKNSILWSNVPSEAGQTEVSNDGGSLSIDHTIIRDGCTDSSLVCTNVSSEDPLLGNFANYGGFSPTFLPEADSPAIDAGDDSACAVVGVDERGVIRPQGPHCDVGAVERMSNEDIIFRNGFDSF